MIRGLQITIRGEELSIRMAERIRMHEAAIDALGARIKERAGDQPFDVRAEDGFKSLGELETEYQQYGDRVTHLMLLRDNLVPDELYTLSKSDLRMAELISPDFKEVSDSDPRVWLDNADEKAIDGLKVTIPVWNYVSCWDNARKITASMPKGGETNGHARLNNKPKTSRSCRSICASTKPSGTIGARPCSTSFADTSSRTRHIGLVRRI